MRQLVLGNLNYSSWSIRPLLVARHAGLPVEEVIVPLDFPETSAKLKEISPTAKVPLPEDAAARAVARAAASEMHAGFPALRSLCPMDIRSRHAAPEMSDGLKADIARVDGLWCELRERFGSGGPFLFGQWSAADAFYAPVVTRFRTYGLPLSGPAQAYADVVLGDPIFRVLEEQAKAEPWWIKDGPDGRSSGYLKPEG